MTISSFGFPKPIQFLPARATIIWAEFEPKMINIEYLPTTCWAFAQMFWAIKFTKKSKIDKIYRQKISQKIKKLNEFFLYFYKNIGKNNH
jgi:hypothetical protein